MLKVRPVLPWERGITIPLKWRLQLITKFESFLCFFVKIRLDTLCESSTDQQSGRRNTNQARRRQSFKQGTKIFQYCTCPAGWVTYNFHLSCKHMHLSFKSICNKEHKGVICNMTSSSNSSQSTRSTGRTSALGRITGPFIDFTRNYEPKVEFLTLALRVYRCWKEHHGSIGRVFDFQPRSHGLETKGQRSDVSLSNTLYA